MKKLKLIAILLIGITSIGYSQQPDDWEWLNPKPQGNSLNGIDFVNDNVGYAAGTFGTILKTADNGVGWTKLNTGISSPFYYLNNLYFLDENNGFGSGGAFVGTPSQALRLSVLNCGRIEM